MNMSSNKRFQATPPLRGVAPEPRRWASGESMRARFGAFLIGVLGLLCGACAAGGSSSDPPAPTTAPRFTHDVADPAFRVRIPGLPMIAMRTHPLHAEKPHLRFMGEAPPYVVSIATPTADPGIDAIACAQSSAAWIIPANNLSPSAVHRMKVSPTTYLLIYGIPLSGAVQLHSYLLSAVHGTHCVEVHVSQMSQSQNDIKPFIEAFNEAAIEER